MNVVVLVGRLSRPPEERVLESGSRLMTLQVTTEGSADRADSVPVVWFDPPARALDLDVGDPVVAVGRVRRRFFKAGGATQSRTEVVAETVSSATRVTAVRSALTRVLERLGTEMDAPGRAGDASAPKPARMAPGEGGRRRARSSR